jgi:hypothetical protein
VKHWNWSFSLARDKIYAAEKEKDICLRAFAAAQRLSAIYGLLPASSPRAVALIKNRFIH